MINKLNQDKDISIVIPAKNEEETIGMLLDELNKVISNLGGYNFEIIVVDDKSTDRTAEIASEYKARVVYNKGKPGKGRALICGFEKAKGAIIVMMDADCSHRPEDIPLLLKALRSYPDTGLVIGSRIYGGSEEYTRMRAFGNLILTYLFGLFHGRYLSDALNGFKAFRKEVFGSYKYTSTEFEIEIELLANTLRSSLKIIEVPSHERARAGGRLKSRITRHGFKFLSRIIWEWMRNKAHPKVKHR